MAPENNNYGKRLYSQLESVGNGQNKKRETVDEGFSFDLRTKETVYRYLCPERKIGSIIGRGGEIVKKMRTDSQAKIIIGESIPGCEERIVTICSFSNETDAIEDGGDYVCAAQDALFRVHERLMRKDASDDEDIDTGASKAYARLLLPADQVGHIIGKGGQMIQSLRSISGANIQILKGGHLPLCANRSDELLQITGEATAVKAALHQVSSRLHSSPSPFHLFPSTASLAHIKDIHSRSKTFSQLDAVRGRTSNYNRQSPVDDADRGGSKRSYNDERPLLVPGPDDTFYRYLFPETKVGSLIGKCGEIVKQSRADSQAKIIVGEKVPCCEERVVTICSSSEKTNTYEDMHGHVCPAQDALLRVHERLVAAEAREDDEHDTGAPLTIVRLLVPTDQTGHIIGKGGRIIHDMRCDSHVHIRVLKDEHLPCANSDDEILQITGEAQDVKKALFQVSCCLYNRPSHLLDVSFPNGSHANRNNSQYEDIIVRARVMDTTSPKGFSLCLLCPSVNIGGVIGKGGIIINQIREESGALIKVDSSTVEDDCIILISAKESSEDPASSIIEAAVQLQPRCSETANRKSGESICITRILVPTSEIGSLIGKGGSVINELWRATRASIRIMPKENLPKVASAEDVLVEISGDPVDVKCALIEVARRLRLILSRGESILSENNGSYCG